jgi:hypothetical protein
MKDFYDIYTLAALNTFESQELIKAIQSTFTDRATEIESRKIIFSKEFIHDENKEKQWIAFGSRTRLTLDFSFSETMEKLKEFINGIYAKKDVSLKWNSEIWKWE